MMERFRLELAVVGMAVVALAVAWVVFGERVVERSPSAVNGEVIVTERQGVRALRFTDGGTTQTAVRVGSPGELLSRYQRLIAARIALSDPHAQRVLIVGGGGGALASYLQVTCGGWHDVDSIEYDPAVVAASRRWFGFLENDRNRVHVADGAAWLASSWSSWDVIVLDAFGAVDYPPHLVTLEFFGSVRSRLNAGGFVLANVLGPGINPRYAAMLDTFRQVFGEVVVHAVPERDQAIVEARP